MANNQLITAGGTTLPVPVRCASATAWSASNSIGLATFLLVVDFSAHFLLVAFDRRVLSPVAGANAQGEPLCWAPNLPMVNGYLMAICSWLQ